MTDLEYLRLAPFRNARRPHDPILSITELRMHFGQPKPKTSPVAKKELKRIFEDEYNSIRGLSRLYQW